MRALIGVHDGHNASACLSAQGRILYAVQEERLSGRKNDGGTPRRAIEACLRFADLEPKDITRLAYGSMRTTPASFRVTDQRRKFLSESTLRGTVLRAFAWRPYYRLNSNLGWRERVRDARDLGFAPSQLTRYDHHTTHAATAYFGMRKSIDERCLIITPRTATAI